MPLTRLGRLANGERRGFPPSSLLHVTILLVCLVAPGVLLSGVRVAWSADTAPRPLLAKGQLPVDWWFVFKFGSAKPFAGCGPDTGKRVCPFGGAVRTDGSFGQQFVYASSKDRKLTKGRGCLGAHVDDPLGATFDQVYGGSFFYVVWNDQFYRDPAICGSSASCGGTWGHSKGMLAWNDAGEGFILQVTTPSWPGSGSKQIGRKSGNTLGCIRTNNNLIAAQHFFALKLTKADLMRTLAALANASVVTDPTKLQIVKNGGPSDVRLLVEALGQKSKSTRFMQTKLSTGVVLISKPSLLKVPPWQMVSALLGGTEGKAATWWTRPWIPTTKKSSKVGCWNSQLSKPGPIDIVTSGEWDSNEIGLIAPKNHAKIGIVSVGNKRYAIFGDLNQQGTLSPPDCDKSQNGRGGLFFVIESKQLFDGIAGLLDGGIAATTVPRE